MTSEKRQINFDNHNFFTDSLLVLCRKRWIEWDDFLEREQWKARWTRVWHDSHWYAHFRFLTTFHILLLLKSHVLVQNVALLYKTWIIKNIPDHSQLWSFLLRICFAVDSWCYVNESTSDCTLALLFIVLPVIKWMIRCFAMNSWDMRRCYAESELFRQRMKSSSLCPFSPYLRDVYIPSTDDTQTCVVVPLCMNSVDGTPRYQEYSIDHYTIVWHREMNFQMFQKPYSFRATREYLTSKSDHNIWVEHFSVPL